MLCTIHTARGRNRPLREVWEVTGCDLESKQKGGGGKTKKKGGQTGGEKWLIKYLQKKFFPQKCWQEISGSLATPLTTLTTDFGRSIRVSIFEHVDWWLGPLLVPFSNNNECGERRFFGPTWNRVEFTPSAYYTCSKKRHQQVQFQVEINFPTIALSRVKPRHFAYKPRWVCLGSTRIHFRKIGDKSAQPDSIFLQIRVQPAKLERRKKKREKKRKWQKYNWTGPGSLAPESSFEILVWVDSIPYFFAEILMEPTQPKNFPAKINFFCT